MPYGNIISDLVKKKGIWRIRFQVNLRRNKDQGIFLGSVLKMGYKLENNECIKFIRGTPLPPTTETLSTLSSIVNQPPHQSVMIFNLFMRIDGKLIEQVVKITKIEEKLHQLETLFS